MSRKPIWPPRVHRHKSGRAFIRWKGHDYYLGVYGSPEAAARLLRVLADLQAGREPTTDGKIDHGLTVQEVVGEWWTREAPRLSERGGERKAYRLSLEPLLALYGPTLAKDFDANALEEVQQAMVTGSWLQGPERAARAKRSNRGPLQWCRRVVNQRLGRVKTVWRWATRRGLVPPNNLDTVPGLKRNDGRVRHLPGVRAATVSELAAVVRVAPPATATMLLLMFWSGGRAGEIRVMRLADLDTSDPGCWIYRPPQHKCDWREHGRALALGKKCQAIIQRWLRLRGADANGFLFPAKAGGPVTADTLSQATRRAAARAGIPGFHPYRCRHAAKKRVTRLMGLDAARAFLGQSSIGTTNSYDEQIDLGLAIEAAKKLG